VCVSVYIYVSTFMHIRKLHRQDVISNLHFTHWVNIGNDASDSGRQGIRCDKLYYWHNNIFTRGNVRRTVKPKLHLNSFNFIFQNAH